MNKWWLYPKSFVLLQYINSVSDVNSSLVVLPRDGDGDWARDYKVKAISRMSLSDDDPSPFITVHVKQKKVGDWKGIL